MTVIGDLEVPLAKCFYTTCVLIKHSGGGRVLKILRLPKLEKIISPEYDT